MVLGSTHLPISPKDPLLLILRLRRRLAKVSACRLLDSPLEGGSGDMLSPSMLGFFLASLVNQLLQTGMIADEDGI